MAKAEDLAGQSYRFAGDGGSGSDGDDRFGRRRGLCDAEEGNIGRRSGGREWWQIV